MKSHIKEEMLKKAIIVTAQHLIDHKDVKGIRINPAVILYRYGGIDLNFVSSDVAFAMLKELGRILFILTANPTKQLRYSYPPIPVLDQVINNRTLSDDYKFKLPLFSPN